MAPQPQDTPTPADGQDRIHTLAVPHSGRLVRLDKFLSRALPEMSRARVQRLLDEQRVTVDDAPVSRRSLRLHGGETVVLREPPPRSLAAQAQDIPIDIVHQDADVVLVNKAAGMVVHPNDRDLDGTLVNALLHHVGDLSGIRGVERPGIVHRIDKGTTGLLVVAKNDHAHTALAEQFFEHSIGRRYLALVWGRVGHLEGTWTSRLGKHPGDPRKQSSKARHGKTAITHYRVQERLGAMTLLECRLETGRTHQIRVHCAEAGFPIVCDPVYGADQRGRHANLGAFGRLLDSIDHQLLHARLLGFKHPTGGAWVEWEVPLPDDYAEVLRQLREDSSRAGYSFF